jgi:hypothetical protein
VAYLEEGTEEGQVFIHLDSPTADPVDPNPFSATTGQHVIDAGTNSNFLVVDRVKAEWKPTAGAGDPAGIKAISAAGNAALRIEADDNDRSFQVVQSTSTNTRVTGYDFELDEFGETNIGSGVTKLIIRTNDVEADEHWSTNPIPENPGTLVDVPFLVEGVDLTVDTGEGFNYGLAVVEPTADETVIPLFEVKLLGEAEIKGESTIGLFTVDGTASFLNTAVDPPENDFHTVDEFEVSAQQVEDATGSVTIGTDITVTALNSSRIGDFFIDSEGTFILDEDASLLTLKSLFIEKDSTAPEGHPRLSG